MNCDIVQDLLPLVHDGVCSQASRQLVETHLATCPACQKALEALRAPLPEEPRPTPDDTGALRALSLAWKQGRRRSWLRGAAVAAVICAILVGAWVAATQGMWFSVDPEKIQLTNVRQLSDGRVLYHLYIDDDLNLRELRFLYDEEGNQYLVPKRALLTEKRESPSLADSDRVTSVAETNAWAAERGIGREIVRIWYGQGENAVLLWEEGMELPPATAADEAAWGFEPGSAEYWANRESGN